MYLNGDLYQSYLALERDKEIIDIEKDSEMNSKLYFLQNKITDKICIYK